MTAKRDFKRRVRERAARTGESYVTARRRLLAAREAAAPVVADSALVVPAMSVVELQDVSAVAVQLGFRCQVMVFPTLLERVEPTVLLEGLRDALIKNPGHPSAVQLFATAFGVRAPVPQRELVPAIAHLPRELRVSALMAGVGWNGAMLGFRVAGQTSQRAGDVAVLCLLNWAGRLVLRDVGEPDLVRIERELMIRLRAQIVPPPLFVAYAGRRYRVTGEDFVIGRSGAVCDLVIRDGLVSRKHAAVVCRAGIHYLTDLGSIHGVRYKGQRVTTKRIAEGDVFEIGEYALAFSFRDDK